MAGRLTVCPTPIGNLGDLTDRARQALTDADLVACEDTRRAGLLYERLELARPRLVSNHDGNEAERAPQIVQQIERGERVVLITDAGTPVDLRPRVPPDPCLHRAWAGRRGAARPLGRDHRACRLGAAAESLALRGIPAAPRRRVGARALGQRDRRRLRVAAPAARFARRAGDAGARAPGSRLPGAHRSSTRRSPGARSPSSRRRFREDVKGEIVVVIAPPGAAPARAPTPPSRSTPCAGWSRPAPVRVRRRASSRRLPARGQTTSTPV